MKKIYTHTTAKFFASCVIMAQMAFLSVSARSDDEDDPANAVPDSVAGSVWIQTVVLPTPEWKQVVIRGDAAKFLYDHLESAEKDLIMRPDGTHFRLRLSSSFGCAKSEIHSRPLFACVSFIRADGKTANGILDPEMGSVARIGVSN